MKTEDNKPGTEAEAVSTLALQAAGVVPVDVLELEGRNHVFTAKRDHTGVIAVDHKVLRPTDDHGNLTERPARIVQGVVLETPESLVDYVRDFKGTGTRLFANISGNLIVAVIDYHNGRADAVQDMLPTGGTARDPDTMADYAPQADFGQHKATLQLAFSEEWATWGAKSDRLMGQVEFARFVHENLPDVKSPDGATLLELIRDLRGTRTKRFTGDVNLNAARESFTYEDRTTVKREGGGAVPTEELEVPDTFTLSIPVYFGGEKVDVLAQIRHDVDDEGRLSLGFKLLRRESIRQQVFQKLVGDVESGTGVPAVFGKRGTGPAE